MPAKRAILLIVPWLLAACAAPYAGRRGAPEGELAARQAIVQYARSLVGTKDLKPLGGGFKNDCSGFITGVFTQCGRTIAYRHVRRDRSLSESLCLTLQDKNLTFAEGYPNIGDAVFFKNTIEGPSTGLGASDRITHVGLVEEVDADGTVLIIHYSSGSVNRLRMNLRHPGEKTNSDGRTINDYLRRSVSTSLGTGASGQPRRDYLAGNLFVAYGDVFRCTEP